MGKQKQKPQHRPARLEAACALSTELGGGCGKGGAAAGLSASDMKLKRGRSAAATGLRAISASLQG